MKNLSMAEAYQGRADACLREAKEAMRHRDYPGIVRRSQECVEFALKGAMRLYGVEHPRKHDVSEVLIKLADRFPKWFVDEIYELGRISSALAQQRGPSVYGDEEKGVPPSELFGKAQASEALKNAGFVFERCKKLLKEFLKKVRR